VVGGGESALKGGSSPRLKRRLSGKRVCTVEEKVRRAVGAYLWRKRARVRRGKNPQAGLLLLWGYIEKCSNNGVELSPEVHENTGWIKEEGP